MNLKLVSIILTFSLLLSCSFDHKKHYTLEEKVGQLVLIGFRGMSLDENIDIKYQIEKYQPGGFILYDYDVPSQLNHRNIESPSQLKNLIKSLKEKSSIPPFIAIDQEGGMVCRLKEKYGFNKTVSAQYLGDLDNMDSTRYYAASIADELKDLGINVNFAPVVDVNVNPDCPIIGKIQRSISDDPQKVAKHASAIINEYRKYDVISSLKHFPGHGSSLNDSHDGYTDVSSTWSETELIPYQILIDSSQVDMIMTAHVYNEFWDARFPATLSDNVIKSFLRTRMGYNGVVVSDDMCMGAIQKNYTLKSSLLLAFEADVDLFIFSNNGKEFNPTLLEEVCNTIIELVNEGKITEDRINESFNRVIQLKNKFDFN